MLIRQRINVSRTAKGHSVDVTLEASDFDISMADEVNKTLRERMSQVMAQLDHDYPREGEQQG